MADTWCTRAVPACVDLTKPIPFSVSSGKCEAACLCALYMCMCSAVPTSQGHGVDRRAGRLSPGIKLLGKPGTMPQVQRREYSHLDTNLHYCLVFFFTSSFLSDPTW